MHMVGFERLLKHLIQNDKLPLNPYLRPMDKIALKKGLQRVFYGILAAFIGPVVIMQAFQNEGHPWYWPVLLIGLLFFCGAIGFGFWGILTLVNALLGKKRKG